jgi:hypothetical protein
MPTCRMRKKEMKKMIDFSLFTEEETGKIPTWKNLL